MKTSTLHLERDPQQVVTLTFDRVDAKANVIDALFVEDFERAIAELHEQTPRGVILRSTKKSFFAGADIDMIFEVQRGGERQLFELVERLKSNLRRLETMGVPVVACLEGAALGGGWEIALSAHHRIALNSASVKIGLPEVNLGLLPGGGGVARTVRLFGLQAALPLLTEGKRYSAKEALENHLIHELVSSPEEVLFKAREWIEANPSSQQPWDYRGYRLPGGGAHSPKLASLLAIAPAMLREKTGGAYPAPEKILSAMVEGALVDFETACRIESRYFIELVCHPISKNMIRAFWYHLNEVNAGGSRPVGPSLSRFTHIGVIGAGMMGAGIAYVAAKSGIKVTLKDLDLDRAERGKDYSRRLVQKSIKRGQLTDEGGEQLLSLIHPSADVEALKESEVVIEAVFEDRSLKAMITAEFEESLATGDGVSPPLLASNTSTLPITGLAAASNRPERFIGLHFFSPVDKMKLVEIICGEETDEQSLAEAYDLVRQLGKTPIVVNDHRGFFTSRVFATYTQEGMSMLAEGVPPSMIERAAALAGFPVGPLAVSDEVSLSLMAKIRKQTTLDLAAEGQEAPAHPAHSVIDRMLELERPGRAGGGGFYDYPDQGGKRLWLGLSHHFPVSENLDDPTPLSVDEVKDRLLYIMAIETARCLEEGVLRSIRDANIGSILGIGFPAWTGGALQFINYTGLEVFIHRARALSERYGDRFSPPNSLSQRSLEERMFL